MAKYLDQAGLQLVLQKLTDKYIANIDTLAKEKEQDIMSI